jgi:hypothetical protein
MGKLHIFHDYPKDVGILMLPYSGRKKAASLSNRYDIFPKNLYNHFMAGLDIAQGDFILSTVCHLIHVHPCHGMPQ